MKRAIFFPGTGETRESVWFPYLADELEKNGYGVKTIGYPDPDKPAVDELVEIALKENYDEETIVVGHSAGVALILALLEKLDVRVKKALLVAGYIDPLTAYEDANLILKDTYDWEKIQKNCEYFVTINSVNDPWGCDDRQGRKIFDRVGGMLILNTEGHMGSDTYNQPYKEFPLLVKLIL